MVMGSPKSIKIVNHIWHLLKNMEVMKINEDMMDEVMRLFVVVYLKSENSIKFALMDDIDRAFKFIKDDEAKIIVDQVFKYQFIFAQIA